MPLLTTELVTDAPGAPLSQTMFDTLTDPAKTIGTSSVKNAGKLVEHSVFGCLLSFLTGDLVSGANSGLVI